MYLLTHNLYANCKSLLPALVHVSPIQQIYLVLSYCTSLKMLIIPAPKRLLSRYLDFTLPVLPLFFFLLKKKKLSLPQHPQEAT